MTGGGKRQLVIGLDVGTTTVRAIAYDAAGSAVAEDSRRIEVLSPRPGWSEIDPDSLWEAVVSVLRGCLAAGGLSAGDIAAMGVSCQRGTFTCWSAETGRHYYNFITWKDLRVDRAAAEWNGGLCLRGLRLAGRLLHGATRSPRFKVASIYRLYAKLVTLRLVWMIDNAAGLRDDAAKGRAMFGCIESWLVYKLTAGARHVTEISSIAATGIYDPFTLDYAGWGLRLFGIPGQLLPPVVDSSGEHFGSVSADILGAPVPIRAVLADQSASVFGSSCYRPGAAKITMGTGSFVDVVTAAPHASMNGLVPLVGWKVKDEVIYLAEGSVFDTGVTVDWAKTAGLYDNVGELERLVREAGDSGGVCFVPGFHGLQVPLDDTTATAGFVGLGLGTTRHQMLRAVLESVAFCQKALIDAFLTETEYKFERIVADGGVARSDFVLQKIADLTGLPVRRPDNVEMSAWGVAALAGLEAGVWASREEVAALRPAGTEFVRRRPEAGVAAAEEFRRWADACHRLAGWHK